MNMFNSNAITAVFTELDVEGAKKALSAFVERSEVAAGGYTIHHITNGMPEDAVYLSASFVDKKASTSWQISMMQKARGGLNPLPDMTYVIWH